MHWHDAAAPWIAAAALLLDAAAGDPWGALHPVVLMGRAVTGLEALARRRCTTASGLRRAGVVVVLAVTAGSYAAAWGLLAAARAVHPALYAAAAALMASTTLAARGLAHEGGAARRKAHRGRGRDQEQAGDPRRNPVGGVVQPGRGPPEIPVPRMCVSEH